MSFGSRLRERRKYMNMSQADIGAVLGVKATAIGNYENGVSSPNADALYKLFDVLKCDANYLFQDEMNEIKKLSAKAMQIAEVYDELDSHGKEAVDVIMATEQRRVEQTVAGKPTKIIPLLATSAAAGKGEPDNGLPLEQYEIDASCNATFAVRISGDSMEPVLKNGQIALCIEREPHDGDVAVIMVNGSLLVKQYIKDFYGNIYLRSINRAMKECDYDIMASGNDTISCYGIVNLKKRPPLVDE